MRSLPLDCVIGVDPGYVTCGLVVLNPAGAVLSSHAFQGDNSGRSVGTLVERTRQAAIIVAAAVNIVARALPRAVMFVETWYGGKNPAVTYWRGRFDGVLEDHCTIPVLSINQSHVKQFVHPTGKAADRGRKTDGEYLMALNQLDTVIFPPDLPKVGNPSVNGFTKKPRAWKDGRQHALDAAVIASVGACAMALDETGKSVPGLDLRPHQLRIAREVREVWLESAATTATLQQIRNSTSA